MTIKHRAFCSQRYDCMSSNTAELVGEGGTINVWKRSLDRVPGPDWPTGSHWSDDGLYYPVEQQSSMWAVSAKCPAARKEKPLRKCTRFLKLDQVSSFSQPCMWERSTSHIFLIYRRPSLPEHAFPSASHCDIFLYSTDTRSAEMYYYLIQMYLGCC